MLLRVVKQLTHTAWIWWDLPEEGMRM